VRSYASGLKMPRGCFGHVRVVSDLERSHSSELREIAMLPLLPLPAQRAKPQAPKREWR
jgi:hypothetical protein